MATTGDKPPRERILFLLKTRGPRTAAELGKAIGVTTMAIRQQLQLLVADGLVAFRDERRRVGRPARVWELTPRAEGRFPDSHADLTVELLRAMKATFGEEGLDRVVTARSEIQRRTYAERLPSPEASLELRVEALARARSDEGYMAEWTREADGSIVLAENHCPICAAARVCQGFCRDELAVFRDVLGPGVTVEREDHVLSGARRCSYRIAPAGRPGQAGPREEKP